MKNTKILNIILILIFLFSLTAPNYLQAQTTTDTNISASEEKGGNLALSEETKIRFKRVFETWEKIQEKMKAWWEKNVLPQIGDWLEERKSSIGEEVKKEIKEFRDEIKKVISGLWEFLKELI